MDIGTLLIFVLLLMMSAFFSWTEVALMSLPKHKIETFVKQWIKWAKDLKYIKENSDKLLITILIWNNLANTCTAAFATTIAIAIAQTSWLGVNQSTAVWIATWIVTLLLLLFWEIVPKSFATKNAEKISLAVAKFYRILIFILSPFIYLIELVTKFLTWSTKQEKISEQEIEVLIDMWKESWTLKEKEHKQLKNLLDLQDTTVEEIMTPRVKIDKLPDEATVNEALDYILSHTHSRIPVYEKDIDHIIWIVNIRILLNEIKKWNSNKKLKEIPLLKPIKVPLNKPISELLKTFQTSKQHLAIVIDEYGGVAWLVTLEDIIEEVFGEIQDETDNEDEKIKKINENEYIVSSDILVDDLLEIFELTPKDLKTEENYEGETISYLITDILQRFPNKNEELTIKTIDNKEIIIKVLEVNDWVIWKVLIKINQFEKSKKQAIVCYSPN